MAVLNTTAVLPHTLLDNKFKQYNFFDKRDVILLLNDGYYFLKIESQLLFLPSYLKLSKQPSVRQRSLKF